MSTLLSSSWLTDLYQQLNITLLLASLAGAAFGSLITFWLSTLIRRKTPLPTSVLPNPEIIPPYRRPWLGQKQNGVDHHWRTINEARQLAEQYFESWQQLTRYLATLASYGVDYQQLSSARREKLSILYRKFVDSRSDKSQALSQLRFLGAQQAISILSRTATMANLLRDDVLLGKILPSTDKLKEWNREMSIIRALYLDSLRVFYQQMVNEAVSHVLEDGGEKAGQQALS